MKLTYFTRAVSNMAGFLSQDLVEKAQEAIRILASIPLPTPSSAGPTTSSGETKSSVCVYTVNACCMYLVTCIQRQKHDHVYRSAGSPEKRQLIQTFAPVCMRVVVGIIV